MLFAKLFILNTYSTSFILFNRESSDDVSECLTDDDDADVVNDGTYVSVVKCLN